MLEKINHLHFELHGNSRRCISKQFTFAIRSFFWWPRMCLVITHLVSNYYNFLFLANLSGVFFKIENDCRWCGTCIKRPTLHKPHRPNDIFHVNYNNSTKTPVHFNYITIDFWHCIMNKRNCCTWCKPISIIHIESKKKPNTY